MEWIWNEECSANRDESVCDFSLRETQSKRLYSCCLPSFMLIINCNDRSPLIGFNSYVQPRRERDWIWWGKLHKRMQVHLRLTFYSTWVRLSTLGLGPNVSTTFFHQGAVSPRVWLLLSTRIHILFGFMIFVGDWRIWWLIMHKLVYCTAPDWSFMEISSCLPPLKAARANTCSRMLIKIDHPWWF